MSGDSVSKEQEKSSDSGIIVDRVYSEIRSLLDRARQQAWTSINSAMVQAYWNIGRIIVEEEQHGAARADYGRKLVQGLSDHLRRDYGQGFDPSNLWNMRAFYIAYPILDALSRELSWTHYRLLLRIEKPDARKFYGSEAVNDCWATRELGRQIQQKRRVLEELQQLCKEGKESH